MLNKSLNNSVHNSRSFSNVLYNSNSNPKIKISINNYTKIPYSIYSCSSQDPKHPVFTLLTEHDNLKDDGWLTNKYCVYPQELIVQFPFLAELNQVNVLIHDKKIPTKIEFVNCVEDDTRDLNVFKGKFKSYENIGFIKLTCNAKNNYCTRELRKIYLNKIKSKFMKLIVHRNYANIYNIFCQVGIVSLQFFGRNIEKKAAVVGDVNTTLNTLNVSNSNLNLSNIFNTSINLDLNDSFYDKNLDAKSKEKLAELKLKLEQMKESEDYDECKVLKVEIDKFKNLTRRSFI